MRRGCHKNGSPAPRGRSRACFYWRAAACNPQRKRTRFTPPADADPCLGGRGLRREAARPQHGY
ncbi:MAG TPA: hypothetical protein VL988_01145 [Solirubrobacteraceae bacterium]|nr:hypothetical protein [Solirubrobacteraceae bacterium]